MTRMYVAQVNALPGDDDASIDAAQSSDAVATLAIAEAWLDNQDPAWLGASIYEIERTDQTDVRGEPVDIDLLQRVYVRGEPCCKTHDTGRWVLDEVVECGQQGTLL